MSRLALNLGQAKRAGASEEAAEVIDLTQVVIEVAEQMDEKLAPGHVEAITLFRAEGGELVVRGGGKDGNDA